VLDPDAVTMERAPAAIRSARTHRARDLGRDAARGAAFLAGLALSLRRPLSLSEARAILADRLAHRTDDFLDLARHAIYSVPESPYRKLLSEEVFYYLVLYDLFMWYGV
jgi:hypothetical protein